MISLFSARLSHSVLTAFASGVLAVFFIAPRVVASDCNPVASDQPATFDQSLTLYGDSRSRQDVQLPAHARILVLAAEQGLDIALKVPGPTLGRGGRADNPIRRSGIQRAQFLTSGSGRYAIEVIGKEGAETHGTVRLRVIVLPVGATTDACLQQQQALANADGAYAAGLTASGQVPGEHTGDDASVHFAAAASGYVAVAKRLDVGAASELLAQVQHAAAAVFYQDLQDWQQAWRWADAAALTYESVHDSYGRARAEAMSAAALMEVAVSPPSQPVAGSGASSAAGLARARTQLAELAAFHKRRHELHDEALVTNNLGLAFYYEDKNAQAIAAYRRALPLYRQLRERTRQAQVLSNIALCEYELDRTQLARAHYSEVLRLLAGDSGSQMYAIALSNMALADVVLGRFDSALTEYSAAQEIFRAIQNRYWEAYVLQGIGDVYSKTGDQDQALGYYQQALKIRSPEVDGQGRVDTLRSIAPILRQRGDAAGAIALHEEALSLQVSGSMRARILVQIAQDLESLGRHREAQRRLDEVMSIAGLGAFDEAVALLERGRVLRGEGNSPAAVTSLRAAIDKFRKLELPSYEYECWLALSQSERSTGRLQEAERSVDTALVLAEQLRTQSANPEFRANLMQPLRPAFDTRISLLADQQFEGDPRASGYGLAAARARAALSVAERSRARALADFGNLDVSAPGVSPAQLASREAAIADLELRRGQLQRQMESASPAASRVQALQNTIAHDRQLLNRIDAGIGARSIALWGDKSQQPPGVSIDTALVPLNTVVVEYWLGTERAVVWLLEREGLTMADLGPSRQLIAAAARFHEVYGNPAASTLSDRTAASADLYDCIVRPIRERLANKSRLVFVPDGVLHYVSFPALLDRTAVPARYLVQDHDVSVTPSATMFLARHARARNRTQSYSALLIADPVYGDGDERLPQGVRAARVASGLVASEILPRLYGTSAEVSAIAALMTGARVDRLEGLSASRKRFLGATLDQYRYIHVASHGVVNADVPQLSALVLSTRDESGRVADGRVRAGDLLAFKLTADAVVLSACESALGKYISGEGLTGLQYVFLARGAHAVVASLWAVPDRATVQLMAAFYQNLLQRRLPAGSAMSAAMRAMLGTRFSDPSMWSAFAVTEHNYAVESGITTRRTT